MNQPAATTRIGPAAAVAAYAVSRGVPLEQITEATGLTLGDLIQPTRRVPDRVIGAIWQFVATRFPDEPIGLQMAQVAPFDFFGPLADVATHAETLRDALRAFVRYRRILSSALKLSLVESPGHAEVCMSHPLDATAPSPAPEAVVGLAVRFVREVIGIEAGLRRVDLILPARGPLAGYTGFFGCAVRFEQDHNRVVFDPAALDLPNRRPDRRRFTQLSKHLDRLHEELIDPDDPPLIQRVKAAIVANGRRGEYGVEALARALGLSTRSLQRQVRGEGTTLRALVEEARLRHAQRLLADPALTVDEVAFMVGYSAESAFRRAYRRWTGRSPAAERQRAGSDQP